MIARALLVALALATSASAETWTRESVAGRTAKAVVMSTACGFEIDQDRIVLWAERHRPGRHDDDYVKLFLSLVNTYEVALDTRSPAELREECKYYEASFATLGWVASTEGLEDVDALAQDFATNVVVAGACGREIPDSVLLTWIFDNVPSDRRQEFQRLVMLRTGEAAALVGQMTVSELFDECDAAEGFLLDRGLL